MRIAMTDRYAFEREWHCEALDRCEGRYCRRHRLLWKDCDTIKRGVEGDREVIGGIHGVYDLGDCPSCEAESRMRKYQQMAGIKR